MSKSLGRRTRRVFSAEFKAKVALEALPEDKTPAVLSQQFELHPNQNIDWKKLLLAQAPSQFGAGRQQLLPEFIAVCKNIEK